MGKCVITARSDKSRKTKSAHSTGRTTYRSAPRPDCASRIGQSGRPSCGRTDSRPARAHFRASCSTGSTACSSAAAARPGCSRAGCAPRCNASAKRCPAGPTAAPGSNQSGCAASPCGPAPCPGSGCPGSIGRQSVGQRMRMLKSEEIKPTRGKLTRNIRVLMRF